MPKANKNKYSIRGCRAETLMGVWLVAEEMAEPIFKTAFEHLESATAMEAVRQRSIEMEEEQGDAPMYTVDDHGIAHMSISGPMTKYPTSFQSLFGGTSTMQLRDALREMRNDPKVRGLMLNMDSPGGTAEGTVELAEAIRKTAAMMPVHAHASDKCASAALFAASQASALTAGPMARVGSVGTVGKLVDSSALVKDSKVKPVYFSTGKFKTIGAPGTEITEEQRAEVQKSMDSMTSVFWTYLSAGRPKTQQHKEEILTARVYTGKEAEQVGLSDGTCTEEQAYISLLKLVNQGSGVGGPSSGGNGNAANAGQPPARSATMLNAQQLAQARALPGGEQIAEENADQILLTIAKQATEQRTALQTELTAKQAEITRLQGQIPKQVDRTVLVAHGGICHKQIDILAKEGKITPAQAQPIKDFFMSGDPSKPDELKLNGPMLTPGQDGKCGYDALLATYDLNKPNGITKELSGAQPAPKTEPGKADQSDDVTGVPLNRQNELRQMAGLPKLEVAKN